MYSRTIPITEGGIEVGEKKLFLVDIDSIFDSPPLSRRKDVYEFALAAIRKAYKLGWGIQFWGAYSRYHYTSLVRDLQECMIWDFVDPETNEPLLLRSHPSTESPTVTKLSLLETHFSHILDGESSTRLVAVEKNLGVAENLRRYSRGKIHVHLSPAAWPNLLAIGNSRFDCFLRKGLVA